MKSNKTDTMIRRLARRMFFRTILFVLVYIAAGIVLYFIAVQVFFLMNPEPDGWLYRVALICQDNAFLIFLAYIFLGGGYILYSFWSRPFSYFQELVNATRMIYQPDDQLVTLSPELGELESQLNQMKMTLIQSQRAAKDAEQRKNDLVTYLAHDLKTPITSVIGYLTLLSDEPDIPEKTRRNYTGIALNKALRLDDLINEFFDITRFNLSHISLELSKINLSLMLNQLVSEFSPILSEKNLSCDLNCPSELSVVCDPDKLQRVLDNLLRNAVNYSFPETTITITAYIEGIRVKMIFENKGNNISPEKLDRLFEQFYRLDSSRSSASGGSGLGLAIAKEIVELHGGVIQATSCNETIRFTVDLPLVTKS